MYDYYFPAVVQVIPHDDYTVSVYFDDGKCVLYDVKPKLGKGLYVLLNDLNVFKDKCMILNDTLAWDIGGNMDETKCLDIDPECLHALDAVDEKTA